MDADRYHPPIHHRGWTFWPSRKTFRGVPLPPPTLAELDQVIDEHERNPVTAIEVTRVLPPEGSGSIAPI